MLALLASQRDFMTTCSSSSSSSSGESPLLPAVSPALPSLALGGGGLEDNDHTLRIAESEYRAALVRVSVSVSVSVSGTVSRLPTSAAPFTPSASEFRRRFVWLRLIRRSMPAPSITSIAWNLQRLLPPHLPQASSARPELGTPDEILKRQCPLSATCTCIARLLRSLCHRIPCSSASLQRKRAGRTCLWGH